jgi:hypothetical protein
MILIKCFDQPFSFVVVDLLPYTVFDVVRQRDHVADRLSAGAQTNASCLKHVWLVRLERGWDRLFKKI